MARQIKVFRTHLGFYDLIVAAPSKKAALEAWGASPHLFTQGFAAETTEPKLVEAALKAPGVVLKRQFGSTGEFLESVDSLRVPKASARKRQRVGRGSANRKARRRRPRPWPRQNNAPNNASNSRPPSSANATR